MKNANFLLALGCAGLLAIAVVLLWPAPADAQSGDEHGWTVWQHGKSQVYPFRDQWKGNATQSGFTFTNTNGVSHYYYGTFHVEFRARDKR